MPEFTAYFNGEWVDHSQVKISSGDRGFRSGDVVFDTARTFNGKIFRVRDHINRLYRSLNYMRIDPGLSPAEMTEITEEVVQRNEHLREPVGDLSVTQFVTRGVGGAARNSGPATVCVEAGALPFGNYSRFMTAGAHGVIVRTRSYPNDAMEPKLKHYSRINFALADLEAADVDPESWPLLTDSAGNLTEGTGYNLALVTDGVIRTPSDNSILQGVSRDVMFELASQLNIPWVEEDLQPYDLYTADEAFLPNSFSQLLPVTKVNNRELGDGKPGPIYQQLMAAWSEMVGLDISDQVMRFGSG